MVNRKFKTIPTITTSSGMPVLKQLVTQRSLLAGLEAMHQELGNIFEINLPGFQPVVMVGPDFSREVLVTHRQQFRWRNDSDPVTRLLRHGLLVEDGAYHDTLRGYMHPALKRSKIDRYLPSMLACTDEVLSTWGDGLVLDMLVEMRRLALMIVMDTLFGLDISPDLSRLWDPILKVLQYISPGVWLLKPDLPRPGYQRSIKELDDYLFNIINERRSNPDQRDDMLADLIFREDMNDDLIRDQLLTMLIAGHDTSTALLSWALYLLSGHPEAMEQTMREVDRHCGQGSFSMSEIAQLHYMDQVIKETLRLYPPIHVGNRIAITDLNLQGYPIERNKRIMLSFYLTHHDEQYWPDHERFRPERFDRSTHHNRPPLSYLPFGGGPRNCIGAAYAQIEVKVILARIIQTFDLERISSQVDKHMAATLEPHPEVLIRVLQRKKISQHVSGELALPQAG